MPSLRMRFALSVLLAAYAGCAEPATVDGESIGVDMRAALTACGVCSGKTPVCDTKARRCVACLVDKDCPGGRCIAAACVPTCSPQKGCGDAGVCNMDAGVCGGGAPGGCTSDADCKDAKLPVCDRAGGRCVACSASADKCPAGSYCGAKAGVPACVAGCKTDDECANAPDGTPASKCCGHVCDDTSASATNCGACDTPCKGASTCCSSACIDTGGDAANCGGCGVVCSSAHATSNCTGGACNLVSCNNNWGNCDNNAGNGCETDLKNDDWNCGRCGKSCVFACLGGSCFPF